MGLPKGKTNNVNGRPKGSKNKSTQELKEMVNTFISNNADQFQADFKKLDPKDRVMLYEKMLKYVLPTQQKMEIYPPVESQMERITLVIKGREK